MLKRSEFEKIVSSVSHEEFEKLTDAIQAATISSDGSYAVAIAEIACSIPAIAARTTAEILVRSGVVSLEADD